MPPDESLVAFFLMNSNSSPKHSARGVLWTLVVAAAWLLGACASRSPETSDATSSGWARTNNLGSSAQRVDGASWQHLKLPGKQLNQYTPVHHEGRNALYVESQSSASIIRHPLKVLPSELGLLAFSWKVPRLIPGADMTDRDLDDSPVRIVLAFDGDRSKLSGRNQMMSELARALTGEEMPYATLMYVWANDAPVGTVIVNPRTDRIRKLVVESGTRGLNVWRDHERDLRADFEKAFGEPPGTLRGIGLMTDTDNTRSSATAWYGPLRMVGATAAK